MALILYTRNILDSQIKTRLESVGANGNASINGSHAIHRHLNGAADVSGSVAGMCVCVCMGIYICLCMTICMCMCTCK